MFLTIHTAAGAIIGKSLPSVWLAFVIGFISHFILDLIPHGDEECVMTKDRKLSKKRFFIIASLDGLITLTLVYSLYTQNFFYQPASIMAGVAGAVLPDFINMAAVVTKQKIFKRFCVLHTVLHDLIPQTKNFQYPGLVLQASFLNIFLFILFL